MIELKKKSVKVKYEGVEYDVRSPSNAELRQFTEGESSDIAKTIGLLDKCGLPEAVCWELDPESLAQVLEALTPKKKS
jgi:hypothetical protein